MKSPRWWAFLFLEKPKQSFEFSEEGRKVCLESDMVFAFS